jgi:taurine dioxygenase
MSTSARIPEFVQAHWNTALEIEPTGAALGAYVGGIDLREALDSALVDELRDALVQHKVLFFRNQNISHENHLRFARYFGALERHPVTQHVEGHPEILRVRNGEYAYLEEADAPFIRPVNKWRAEATFRAAPPLGGVIRARLLPPRGGDTVFADTEAAYADLEPALQERIEHLTATHDLLKNRGEKLRSAERALLRSQNPPQSHPVVRIHPESGRRSIFVNPSFTTRIDGVEEKESDRLLALLFDRIRVHEYQVRFGWTPNAVVLWDNRSTQLYPIADYWPHDREIERVTIVGDAPMGPH